MTSRTWGALAVAVALCFGACGDDSWEPATTVTSAGDTTITAPSPATSTTAPPSSSTAPTTTTGSTTTLADTTTTSAPPELELGSQGQAVHAVERRLSELGYWTGPVNESFDHETHHAVVALQKVAGIERDGIVGVQTLRALDEGTQPAPRSSEGRVVEVVLDLQVVLLVDEGRLLEVFDTSTGIRAGTTPPGRWTITREIDGVHVGSLGVLYRPKYFKGGVAIHGYASVPPSPASHGCVRVTFPSMDRIWATDLVPLGTAVWVY